MHSTWRFKPNPMGWSQNREQNGVASFALALNESALVPAFES